eukprot:16960-Pelagococcus_subviridis.AAC.1
MGSSLTSLFVSPPPAVSAAVSAVSARGDRLQHLHGYDVADLHDVPRVRDAIPRQLRDVNQTLAPRRSSVVGKNRAHVGVELKGVS